ncbi:MAG: hypothetical protein CEN87_434 [Parcubacteria group bacterium Licking1014_1]|nr:MAG: hypothetical protein CEN87_434 [Parcubacteria group bacterium Licking1014_1]
MTTKALKQVFSASISNLSDLIVAKARVRREFDDNLKKIYPQRFLVIVDGKPFKIEKEEDFDEFSKKLDEYFKVRNSQRKIITVSLFSEIIS